MDGTVTGMETTTTSHDDIDPERRAEILTAMLAQIGTRTILATSGGRIRYGPGRTMVTLPVAYGYTVEVEYTPGVDLYTVRRVFTRGAKRWVKGEADRVFCEELSETVYRAGCYLDRF